jgi:hypothetical protein
MSMEEAEIGRRESRMRETAAGDRLLLQIRSDRRLGHEWDDWDGHPLPNGGVFTAGEGLFFQLVLALILGGSAASAGTIWLLSPRLEAIWAPLDRYLTVAVVATAVLSLLWLGAIAAVVSGGRNWLPEKLAERGLVPWLMPRLEKLTNLLGLSRDRAGNAMLRVFNRLSIARTRGGVKPEELLILIPRCLGKDAMRQAMDVSVRYGVPVFVAARGRYARQMIAMRRPKGIIAVACERDLVSGVHDVAGSLPVLGTTLQLGDGPCRNTEFEILELENQVRAMLGLATVPANVATA